MATANRKSIHFLFLGGATLDERERHGDVVTKAAHVKPWLERMVEMDMIATTTGEFISAGSANLGLTDWMKAAACIKHHYAEVDGFVIVHQLETLPSAAIAFALMMQKLDKPVVLCGSPLLMSSERAAGRQRTLSVSAGEFGAKANFINAVQVAVSDIAEVVVVHGSRIYRGSTVSGPMSGLQGEVIGKIDFGIRFFGPHQRRDRRSFRLADKFDTRVAVVEYLPGVDLKQLMQAGRGTRAVFLSSPEGVGVLMNVLTQVRSLVPRQMAIVVLTDATHPTLPGTIPLIAPTRSVGLLRLMWALGQTSEPAKLLKLLNP